MRETLDQIVEIVKQFEGFRAKAYKCPAGVWTIGYGETLGVKEGMIWTEEYATERLKQRVMGFLLSCLNDCPQLLFEPPERLIACTSLAYNIGQAAFKVCSVNRRTREYNYEAAADAFLLWNKAGGRILKGLTIRRALERKIYLYGY